MNPPGFGKSAGPVSVQNYVQAALASFEFLSNRYDRVPIWVYGKSIGATAAVYLAAHRKPTALILRNLIDVPSAAYARVRPWCPRQVAEAVRKSVPNELNPAIWAPDARAHAVFVAAKLDRVSAPTSQHRVAQLYGGPSVVVHVEGGHDQPALHPSDEAAYAAAIRKLWTASWDGGPLV
jgi:hypothetical protein